MTDAAAHGVSAPSPAAGRDRFRATDRRGGGARRGGGGGGGGGGGAGRRGGGRAGGGSLAAVMGVLLSLVGAPA
ncbi:hypothetical protein, partial [Nocardia abscessus]|uniref:hypothetical protein n=1 Tax=Nocardia abscessus TaxID=120957 RepID=UPI00245540BF